MLRRVLNGVLALGDIRNVERACDRIVEQALTTRRASLSPGEREELVAFLIGEAWVLWRRYDPEKGAKFSTFAYPQLRNRVLDYWRKKVGRQRPGRATKDNPGEWGVLSTGELDESELERVLGSGRRDDPADRLPAFSGLQPARSVQARRLADAGRGAAPRRVA